MIGGISYYATEEDAVEGKSHEAGFGHREDEPVKDPALKNSVFS